MTCIRSQSHVDIYYQALLSSKYITAGEHILQQNTEQCPVPLLCQAALSDKSRLNVFPQLPSNPDTRNDKKRKDRWNGKQ